MASKAKPKRKAKITRRQRNKPNFWDNVKKTATHWLWRGVIGKQTGYGFATIRLGKDGNGKTISTTAQRIAYMLIHHKPVPKGRSITQTCGLKLCVRHLALAGAAGGPKAKVVAAKGKGKRPKVRKPRPAPKAPVKRAPRRPKPPAVPPPPVAPAPPEPSELGQPLDDLA